MEHPSQNIFKYSRTSHLKLLVLFHQTHLMYFHQNKRTMLITTNEKNAKKNPRIKETNKKKNEQNKFILTLDCILRRMLPEIVYVQCTLYKFCINSEIEYSIEMLSERPYDTKSMQNTNF